MATGQPATIAADLSEQVKAWLRAATGYAEKSDFRVKLWLRDAERLAGVNAASGSIIRALVFQCVGDIESALYWSNNVRQLGNSTEAAKLEAIILSNLGYFTKAAEQISNMAAADRAVDWQVLVLCGSFSGLLEADQRFPDAAAEGFKAAVALADGCRMSLGALRISEAHLRQVLDLAGEVLRERRLFFIGETPVIHAHDEGVLYELLIDVEPAKAAELTNEVVHRMVASDLDVPGLAFAFVGTRH